MRFICLVGLIVVALGPRVAASSSMSVDASADAMEVDDVPDVAALFATPFDVEQFMDKHGAGERAIAHVIIASEVSRGDMALKTAFYNALTSGKLAPELWGIVNFFSVELRKADAHARAQLTDRYLSCLVRTTLANRALNAH